MTVWTTKNSWLLFSLFGYLYDLIELERFGEVLDGEWWMVSGEGDGDHRISVLLLDGSREFRLELQVLVVRSDTTGDFSLGRGVSSRLESLSPPPAPPISASLS